MRTIIIVAAIVLGAGALVALVAGVALRALRKYVRALWPHS